MNWKMNPKTGRMEQVVSPAKEIEKALIPLRDEKALIPLRDEPKWHGMRIVRDGVKILYTDQYYLAVSFNGKWRLLGLIANMPVIEKYLRAPLVNFHDAWLKGVSIDEPKIN